MVQFPGPSFRRGIAVVLVMIRVRFDGFDRRRLGGGDMSLGRSHCMQSLHSQTVSLD